MKKLLMLVGLLLLAGCASLEDKDVVIDSGVQGFKVTTGADTTSGTPLPNVSAGWGNMLLITKNTRQNGTLEFEKISGSFFGSIFGISVQDTTKVRITSGDGKVKITTTSPENTTVTTEVGGGTATITVKDDTVITTIK